MLSEDMPAYILSDIEDDTTFVNQNEYIECLDEIRKCNRLLETKY